MAWPFYRVSLKLANSVANYKWVSHMTMIRPVITFSSRKSA